MKKVFQENRRIYQDIEIHQIQRAMYLIRKVKKKHLGWQVALSYRDYLVHVVTEIPRVPGLQLKMQPK